MRILAIRGENLASLAGPFEVDLETESIRSAGIFAITGPTGAGKSTLFDAVCLALFDRLPRMDFAENKTSVGKADGSKQIQYNDVRGVLRHGTARGFAEVDFVGQDHRRYRARWEVRRAHDKLSGNLQPQKITLTDLESGQFIGDKKTETLNEIERRIGLSFDQFRRAVLLAQGDFDTFINSGAKDRADLLEKITGTEIYTRISQAASTRAKKEREAIEQLERQLGEHQPLNDEVRIEVINQIDMIRAEIGKVETLKVILTKGRDWFVQREKLESRVTECQRALEESESISSAAQSDRKTLSDTRKALSLRAELEGAGACKQKRTLADARLLKALEAENRAIVERDRIISDYEGKKVARDRARIAYHEIGPELDKAQHLDAFIEKAEEDLTNCKDALNRCLTGRNQAQGLVITTEDTLKKLVAQCAENDRWLSEHKNVEELSRRIEEVIQDLEQWRAFSSEILSTRSRVQVLEEEAITAFSLRREKEDLLEALQAQENGLAERIAARRADISETDKGSIEVKRDAIINCIPILDQGIRAAEDALKAYLGLQEADAERAAYEGMIQEAANEIAAIDALLPTERARLEEARRSFALSEAAGSTAAEHLRLKLQEGAPCPVCGSSEHPVTEVDRVLRDRVDGDRKRVAELEEAISTRQRNRGRAEDRTSAATEMISGITKRRAGHQIEFDSAERIWEKIISTISPSCEEIGVSTPHFNEDLTQPDASAPMIALRNSVDQMMIEIKGALKRISDTEADIEKFSSEREGVRLQREAASNEIVQLREQEQGKSSESRELGGKMEEVEKAFAAVSSRIDNVAGVAFPDWKNQAAAPGEEFPNVCRSLSEEWRIKKRDIEEGSKKIASYEADMKGHRATLEAAESAVTEAQKNWTEKEAEREKLKAERAAVIWGRPAKEVRTEYRRKAEDTEKAFHEVDALKSPVEKLAAAKSAEVINVREATKTAGLEHESSEALLSEKLRSAGISREVAEAAIEKGESWVETEQLRLDRLRESVTAAKATLGEAQKALAEHDENGRPELPREEIEAAHSEIEKRLSEMSENLLKARTILLRDDEARARVTDIKSALDERREKGRVWAQLDELIGSADGLKFRRFAQSLTLRHLILLANRHLSNLYPRYELQSATGEDLALQVIDHYMADEIRGVHNLSGGERFLVSLALALGLASMSSGRGVRVESLFIDEGFGSLDSSSLAMAISVLEQLQATGRRVGVISHMEELKERISVRVEVRPVGGGRSVLQVVAS